VKANLQPADPPTSHDDRPTTALVQRRNQNRAAWVRKTENQTPKKNNQASDCELSKREKLDRGEDESLARFGSRERRQRPKTEILSGKTKPREPPRAEKNQPKSRARKAARSGGGKTEIRTALPTKNRRTFWNGGGNRNSQLGAAAETEMDSPIADHRTEQRAEHGCEEKQNRAVEKLAGTRSKFSEQPKGAPPELAYQRKKNEEHEKDGKLNFFIEI
jgi:hypothetical protein